MKNEDLRTEKKYAMERSCNALKNKPGARIVWKLQAGGKGLKAKGLLLYEAWKPSLSELEQELCPGTKSSRRNTKEVISDKDLPELKRKT